MAKESEFTIEQSVIQAVKKLTQPWIKTGLELPRISIIELSRRTKLPAINILQAVINGRVVLNSSFPPQQAVVASGKTFPEITKPRKSRVYQRAESKIRSEGQRYQRRFQFQPINTKGKPTCVRIENLVKEEQIRRVKIDFVPALDKKNLTKRKPTRRETRAIESSSPLENLRSVIRKESQFPAQNLEMINARLTESLSQDKPFSLLCFICLNMSCEQSKGLPVYKVSQGTTRVETPRISRRTLAIIRKFESSGIPFTWTFAIADTDAKEIYGEWLESQDPSPSILEFYDRLRNSLGNISPNIRFALWSDIQAPFQLDYQTNFNKVYEQVPNIVGQEALDRSIDRRLEYFKGKGLPGSKNIRDICEITARRNIALYGAQGPIIDSQFDCLVVADPDPLRMGRNQSILVPNLPIWYPYPG